MGRLSEEYVDILPEHLFKSEGYSSRRSPYSARYVHKYRMVIVAEDALFLKLRNYAPCGYRITEEQIRRSLVVYKVALLIACRQPSSLSQTVTLNPSFALIIPMESPRFPVDPTATLY